MKKPDLGDSVVQHMNTEDYVSMNELIELAMKKKDNKINNETEAKEVD